MLASHFVLCREVLTLQLVLCPPLGMVVPLTDCTCIVHSKHSIIQYNIIELSCIFNLFIEPTFGCSIEALAARTHRSVPLFLENLIPHIEKKGLSVIGLYRLSGNASQVQKLRYLLEESECVCIIVQMNYINLFYRSSY